MLEKNVSENNSHLQIAVWTVDIEHCEGLYRRRFVLWPIHGSAQFHARAPPQTYEGMTGRSQPPDFNPTLAPHLPVPYPVSDSERWEQMYRRARDDWPVNRVLDREQGSQNLLFTAVVRL
jgi:hypothetical protein